MMRVYSYASSVCELFFSMIKRTDINPQKISTGKSKLNDVAKLVHQRILEVKPATIVLFTHHIILHLFKYLQFSDI